MTEVRYRCLGSRPSQPGLAPSPDACSHLTFPYQPGRSLRACPECGMRVQPFVVRDEAPQRRPVPSPRSLLEVWLQVGAAKEALRRDLGPR